MTSTITVEIDPNFDIEGQIVAVAAQQLLSSLAGVDDEGDPHYKASPLAARLASTVNDAIAGYVKENVETATREILARPLPATDRYGDPLRGSAATTQTLAEKIHNELAKELIQRPLNHHGSNSNESVLSKIIREEVKGVLGRELQAELKAAKATVREILQGEAAKLLGEQAVKAVGV